MTVTSVCFDLDDTLYPYAEYARAGLRSAADWLRAVTGHNFLDDLETLYFEEGVRGETFDRLVDRHDDLSPDLVEDLVAAYHASDGPLDTYPETEAVLDTLGESYRLGLVTDGRNGHAKVRRLGIGAHFEAVLVNHAHGLTKRETEPFDQILSELSVSPERAVYVGDDPRVDFAVPNRLGMGTVRVRRGRYADLEPDSAAAEPDTVVADLTALLKLLDAETARPGESLPDR